MRTILFKAFVTSAQAILVATALLKAASLAAGGAILDSPDPVLRLPVRYVLAVAIVFELAIVCSTVASTRMLDKLFALSGACAVFGSYHLAMFLVQAPLPCACLGHVLQGIGLSQTAERALAVSLFIYLACGTLASLLGLAMHRDGIQRPCVANEVDRQQAELDGHAP